MVEAIARPTFEVARLQDKKPIQLSPSDIRTQLMGVRNDGLTVDVDAVAIPYHLADSHAFHQSLMLGSLVGPNVLVRDTRAFNKAFDTLQFTGQHHHEMFAAREHTDDRGVAGLEPAYVTYLLKGDRTVAPRRDMYIAEEIRVVFLPVMVRRLLQEYFTLVQSGKIDEVPVLHRLPTFIPHELYQDFRGLRNLLEQATTPSLT